MQQKQQPSPQQSRHMRKQQQTLQLGLIAQLQMQRQ